MIKSIISPAKSQFSGGRNPLGWLVLIASLVACTTPAQRLDQQAQHLGLIRQVLRGTDYWHIIYYNHNVKDQGMLHIYLAGDGQPWLGRYWVASDPTSRQPMVLDWLAQDPAPGVYLGRPCYHGQAQSPPCHPTLWTSHRYSTDVVASMAAVVADLIQEMPQRPLVWIGYSGGGTLAMLLAERFLNTRAVLTVVANLDPDRWSEYHGYTRLTGSLNPALRPPLPTRIKQLHYAGGKDKNVPEMLIRQAIVGQPNPHVMVYPDFDHRCCWKGVWPDILGQLRSYLNRHGNSQR